MAVFDTRVQPPVEMHKPTEKHSDIHLDTAPLPSDPPVGLKKTFNDVWNELDLGPLSYEDKGTLKNIINENLEAFALSTDDIGDFKEFSYPLKYKPDADPK